ncbi:hypothetical protein [Senegalimassilia anaerobia]
MAKKPRQPVHAKRFADHLIRCTQAGGYAKHFGAHREQLAALFTKSGPAAPAGIPSDPMCVPRVSAFSHTVTWWFDNGAHATPGQVAA